MMYRRNAAQTPRVDYSAAGAKKSLATMAADAALDFLMRIGLYERAQRENRQRTRRIKRDGKLAAYRANGLNGPRAMARRARQWDRLQVKAAALAVAA